MQQYLQLLTDCLNGSDRDDRTGTGTRGVFGRQIRFDLADGFPLVTTKKIHMKSVIYELLWFISGNTNIKYLNDHGVHIWDEWANSFGDLGPVYGHQWRQFGSFYTNDTAAHGADQLANVIDSIKNQPHSRRHIVTAWNPVDINDMALPPCHCLYQFYVNDGRLDCQLYQRSADVFLGVPFNIASYALLTMMVAQVCALEPGEFVHTFGDLHLYKNHFEQAVEQLTRDPFPLPIMEIDPSVRDIDQFEYRHFKLINYQHHPHIKAEVSV